MFQALWTQNGEGRIPPSRTGSPMSPFLGVERHMLEIAKSVDCALLHSSASNTLGTVAIGVERPSRDSAPS